MNNTEKQQESGELRVYLRRDLKKVFVKDARKEGRTFSKQLDKILEYYYNIKEGEQAND